MVISDWQVCKNYIKYIKLWLYRVLYGSKLFKHFWFSTVLLKMGCNFRLKSCVLVRQYKKQRKNVLQKRKNGDIMKSEQLSAKKWGTVDPTIKINRHMPDPVRQNSSASTENGNNTLNRQYFKLITSSGDPAYYFQGSNKIMNPTCNLERTKKLMLRRTHIY